MITWRLSYAELLLIAQVGSIREIESIFKRREDRRRSTADGAFDGHIYGAAGEYVVGQYLDLGWNLRLRRFGESDIGQQVHVRTRTRRSGPCQLILRDFDPPTDDPWVHAITDLPREPLVHLMGWAFDPEIRQACYRQDPNGAGEAWWFAVPTAPCRTRPDRALPRQSRPDLTAPAAGQAKPEAHQASPYPARACQALPQPYQAQTVPCPARACLTRPRPA